MKKILKIVGIIIVVIIVLGALGGDKEEKSLDQDSAEKVHENTEEDTKNTSKEETVEETEEVVKENTPPSKSVEWGSEQLITVEGFDDHVMEVTLSPDGEYLLYNQDGAERDLYYAKRIDDLTFEHMGTVKNTVTDAIDGTPTFGSGNTLYYFTLENIFTDRRTLRKGEFKDGVLLNKSIVSGAMYKDPHLTSDGAWATLDPEVTADESIMVYAEGYLSGPGFPNPFNVRGVEKVGGVYKKIDNSIFASINDDELQYAPSISNNGLELYYSSIKVSGFIPKFLGVYMATRSSKSEPFGEPIKIKAITGNVEAPSLSADEQYLYYHKKMKGTWQAYRVKRQ